MTTRLSDRTTTDPVVRGIVVVTVAVTIVAVLALVRAATGGRVHHVTVRVDNRAGLAVQVDALDAAGDRVGLGEARSRTLRTFDEVPDRGLPCQGSAAQDEQVDVLGRTSTLASRWRRLGDCDRGDQPAAHPTVSVAVCGVLSAELPT